MIVLISDTLQTHCLCCCYADAVKLNPGICSMRRVYHIPRSFVLSWWQIALDEATGVWGIKVERVEIKDVKLPIQLQRAMAAEAEASREARAKVRHQNTLQTVVNSTTFVASNRSVLLYLCVGDCSWGWDECIAGTEGSISGDRGVTISTSAAIPSDSKHHRSWAKLHHHLPPAHWYHSSFYI